MTTVNKTFKVKNGLTVEGGSVYTATGTTTVAPIIFTSGTNLTSATAGAMEFDGTRLYFSPSTTRKTIAFTDDVLTSLSNSIAIKFDSGTTEGTDLYTFNGSAPKTFSINGGTNITITKTANTLSIASLNYYPTAFAWTDGTTSGPTGSLTGTGMSAVSYAAIPSANATVSGIVTTAAQTFAGVKTFASPIITTAIDTTSTTVNVVNANATTVNFANAATTISIGAAAGTTTFNGNVTITNNLTVNGTVTTINSTTITVDDKNLVLGNVASSSNTTADGGGITIEATTGGDKTFNWVNATGSWTSSENLDIASGKVYKINGTNVLTATAVLGYAPNSLNSNSTMVVRDASGNFGANTITANLSGTATYAGTANAVAMANVTGMVNTSTTTTGTTAANIATLYSSSTYTGAKLVLKAVNGANTELTEILVITDGTNVYQTQYGDVTTSASLVTIDFTYTTTNVNMIVTPVAGTTGTTTIKVNGTLI